MKVKEKQDAVPNMEETPVPAAPVAPATKKEPTYPVASLRKNCVKLFHCTSSTFDGAFAGQDKDKEYSTREAEQALKAWLRKEIR